MTARAPTAGPTPAFRRDSTVERPRAGESGSADHARGERPRVLTALYPLAFAVFPTLASVSATVGTYTPADLALVLGAIVVVAAVIVAACAGAMRLLGRDRPLARGALLALVVVAWVFYFVPTQDVLLRAARPLARAPVLGALWLVPSAVVCFLAVRRRWSLGGAAKVLSLAGALLVVTSAIRVTSMNVGSARRIDRSAIGAQMRAPVPVNPSAVRPGPKRDIYLVILDGYPNAAVLRTRFGFDNTPFLDSLRALGFVIPRVVRSNYVSTMLSLMSTLNFEHDTLLKRELPPNSLDHTFAIHFIRDNRLTRFLKERGYRYYLFPTEWSEPTRRSQLADYTYPGPPERSVLAELRRSELRRVVLASTLLTKFRALQGGYGGRFILDEFRALREVPSRPDPTFTFAHFMLPHQPTVLDGECRPINPKGDFVGERVAMPGPRDTFLGSIRCGNRLVLSLVGELLRRSSTPPIILLIGDHGTLSRGWAIDAKLPTDSIAAERLAPLGAFYMPDGGGAQFADSVTHVNIFRNVLRYYFGADLPPASNEAFFNQATEAYMFRPVDERAVIGG